MFFTPAEAPEDEAQAAVGVQADGHLPGRVQLALQLDGAAEGTGGCVRHLNETKTSFIVSYLFIQVNSQGHFAVNVSELAKTNKFKPTIMMQVNDSKSRNNKANASNNLRLAHIRVCGE